MERPADHEARVLFAAPTRRDAEVTAQVLAAAGIDCLPCADLARLAAEIASGAGAILLTDAALRDPALADVVAALAGQPRWSDVPTVILTRERDRLGPEVRPLRTLSNVTLLDRPCSPRSMVSAVESALRGRARQFQTRDHLRQLDSDQAALRDADVRKDRFLATLAHELRNPLAAILSGTQVLIRSAADPVRTARMTALVERQTRLLARLIDDLMDVSRVSTGKVALTLSRIDLRSVLEAALETVRPQVETADHELVIRTPDAPIWVLGDLARLAQVVANLIGNAAKYTSRGGRITVELEQQAGRAILRVADTGSGIPPEMLQAVFDMFTQVEGTLALSQGGLGIGLSLVRQLMELHGGSAIAESAGVGRGSRFTIELPVAADAKAAAGTPAVEVAGGGDAGQVLRILVIDDNVDLADTLALGLRGDGHVVRTAYGGAAGLAAAAEFDPEVVVCDLGMPGVDGYSVAASLRSSRPEASTLLVAITGWGTDEVRRRARESGFDRHLTKPVSVVEVRSLLSGQCSAASGGGAGSQAATSGA